MILEEVIRQIIMRNTGRIEPRPYDACKYFSRELPLRGGYCRFHHRLEVACNTCSHWKGGEK